MYKKIILASLAAVALCSCGNNNDQGPAIPEKQVMTVKLDTCSVPFLFPAQIKGKQDIDILPQVQGTLDKVLVKEGDKVRKGQVMFIIDDTHYRAAVDNAIAVVEMSAADVETQELELDATRQLFEKGVVSEHQLKVQNNELMVAKAKYDESVAALNSAKNDLNHTQVLSPHDGVVGDINYRQGSLVSPTIAKPLTVVSDNSSVYAYISINSDKYIELATAMDGKKNMIKALPPMDLLIAGDILYEYKGKVETVSGIIDAQTGALSIRVAFPNPKSILTAGGSGVVRMYIHDKGIVIPRTATYELQDKNFVYKVVKQEDGSYVAKSTVVKLYRLDDLRTVVTEGLQDGDMIVLDGVRKMNDNMQITFKQ